MDQTELEKTIAAAKAREEAVMSWLEKHLVWVIGGGCLVVGLILGHLI